MKKLHEALSLGQGHSAVVDGLTQALHVSGQTFAVGGCLPVTQLAVVAGPPFGFLPGERLSHP